MYLSCGIGIYNFIISYRDMVEKALESFKKDFDAIRKKGFVESHRKHNTGIGKTFEDLIGVEENNNLLIDYMDEIELKSSRELSNSMVTLFTKSPSYPPKVNTVMRETFGKEEDGMKILHTTIPGDKFNTFLGKLGFKLDIDEKEEKVFIRIKNLEDDKLIDFECYYTFEDLRKIIETKCKFIAFISAKNKKEDDKELFHFENATLLSGLTFEKFLEAVKKGYIQYDIRIGVYRTGKNKGKSHDHGSGFRIKKNRMDETFKVEEI